VPIGTLACVKFLNFLLSHGKFNFIGFNHELAKTLTTTVGSQLLKERLKCLNQHFCLILLFSVREKSNGGCLFHKAVDVNREVMANKGYIGYRQ
jgi:hypothetical protein